VTAFIICSIMIFNRKADHCFAPSVYIRRSAVDIDHDNRAIDPYLVADAPPALTTCGPPVRIGSCHAPAGRNTLPAITIKLLMLELAALSDCSYNVGMEGGVRACRTCLGSR
jgi:hypothetical protein